MGRHQRIWILYHKYSAYSFAMCVNFIRNHTFLNGSPIPVVEEVKCLRIISGRKLSFLPHLHYLENKGTKALNIPRVLGVLMWLTVWSKVQICMWPSPEARDCGWQYHQQGHVQVCTLLQTDNYGAHQYCLLHFYKSLIRFKLDYGCIVYCCTRGSYL